LDARFTDLAPLPRRIATPAGLDAGSLPVGRSLPGWTGGETAGLARLQAWTPRLRDYETTCDQPAADATSRLSPYLHFGCVSPSDVAARLWARPGAGTLIRQRCR